MSFNKNYKLEQLITYKRYFYLMTDLMYYFTCTFSLKLTLYYLFYLYQKKNYTILNTFYVYIKTEDYKNIIFIYFMKLFLTNYFNIDNYLIKYFIIYFIKFIYKLIKYY